MPEPRGIPRVGLAYGLRLLRTGGRPQTRGNVTRRFHLHAKAAGGPLLPFHAFRHTSARGRPESPKLVQQRLGRASQEITLGTYGQLTSRIQRARAVAADCWWDCARPGPGGCCRRGAVGVPGRPDCLTLSACPALPGSCYSSPPASMGPLRTAATLHSPWSAKVPLAASVRLVAGAGGGSAAGAVMAAAVQRVTGGPPSRMAVRRRSMPASKRRRTVVRRPRRSGASFLTRTVAGVLLPAGHRQRIHGQWRRAACSD